MTNPAVVPWSAKAPHAHQSSLTLINSGWSDVRLLPSCLCGAVLAVTLVTTPATSAALKQLWKDEVSSTSSWNGQRHLAMVLHPFSFHQTAQKKPQKFHRAPGATHPTPHPPPPQNGFERLKYTSATSGIKVLNLSREMRVVGVLG